jgi:hypothetical protein
VRATDVEPGFWSLLDDATVLRMAGVAHPEVGVVLPAIVTGHLLAACTRSPRR